MEEKFKGDSNRPALVLLLQDRKTKNERTRSHPRRQWNTPHNTQREREREREKKFFKALLNFWSIVVATECRHFPFPNSTERLPRLDLFHLVATAPVLE